MIECRYCRDVFRTPVEKIGARCPTCRMPLFEKDRHRPPVVDLGPCAFHKNNSAVAKCQRCGKMMCALCRSRWDEEIVCTACLDQGLQKGETSPRVLQTQNRQATWSLLLAISGWSLMLLALWPLSSLFRGQPDRGPASFAAFLFFTSFFFSLFALGQAADCIRMRGQRLSIATWSLALAGTHLGISLGVL